MNPPVVVSVSVLASMLGIIAFFQTWSGSFGSAKTEPPLTP